MLISLPANSSRAHELRRRLAVVFLYDDPALGRLAPDEAVHMRGLIDRLADDDFKVSPDMDFAELRACILLLNFVVDDGSFVRTDDANDEKKFNEEVDELAARLRGIWRRINDAGMKLARTEAKSVIEWVQQRLSHSVRTRRKAKHGVFDMPNQDDPFLPRQQEFLKKFFAKPAGSTPKESVGTSPVEAVPPSMDEDTILVKGG